LGLVPEVWSLFSGVWGSVSVFVLRVRGLVLTGLGFSLEGVGVSLSRV